MIKGLLGNLGKGQGFARGLGMLGAIRVGISQSENSLQNVQVLLASGFP